MRHGRRIILALAAAAGVLALLAGCGGDGGTGYRHYLLGAQYLRDDSPDGAVLELEKALEAGFQKAFVLNDLGTALMEIGREAEAESHLRKAASEDPAFSRPLYNLGLLHYRNKQFDKALKALREAVKRHAGLPEYFLLLARAEVAAGTAEAAEQTLRQAVQKFPGNRSASHDLGVVCLLLGKAGESERLLRAATDDPDLSRTAYYNLGLLYGTGIEPDEPLPPATAEAFLNIARNNPQSSETLFELGKTYLFLSVDAEAKRNQEVAQAFSVLGDTEQKRGNLRNAIIAFETALKVHAGNIPAMKNLGMLYGHLGQPRKARRLFEDILARQPERVDVREMLDALEASSGDGQTEASD